MHGSRVTFAVAALACALPSAAVWACASCACTLSADAAMGYSADRGMRLDVEYDYIHQDELRHGRHRVSGVPDGNEWERETLNRYFTVGALWTPNADWNFGVKVPWVTRTHSTYGAYDSSAPLPELSHSRSSSVGDLKLIGAYQGFLPTHTLGIKVGIKLPTGAYGSSVKFSDGPLAGQPLDASLQPGTGSTDLILGAYYYRAVSQDFDATFDAQYQTALTHRLDRPGNDFRPGNSETLSVGLRYAALNALHPQLQLNLLHKSADQGALADAPDTVGTVAYVSPGLSVHLAKALEAYAFAQVPVYSNLDGYQLFPRYTVSIGASYAF